jgi:hypothetical protein
MAEQEAFSPIEILTNSDVRPALYSQVTTGSFHRNKAAMLQTSKTKSTGIEIKNICLYTADYDGV